MLHGYQRPEHANPSTERQRQEDCCRFGSQPSLYSKDCIVTVKRKDGGKEEGRQEGRTGDLNAITLAVSQPCRTMENSVFSQWGN